jgi:hypothetical protein
MLYVPYVHFTKAKHIHKRNPYFLQKGCYTRTMTARVRLQKKKKKKKGEGEISGHEPQEACRQDDLIDCKPPVVK